MLSSVLAGVLTTLASPTTSTADLPEEASNKGRFDLLGVHVCLDAAGDTESCDVRLFPPPGEPRNDEPPRVPVQLTLLGASLCLGPVPEGTACDIRLGEKAANDPPNTAA